MIAIDLGSNTIRFIEYDGTHWGKSFEKIVRTAEALHESGKIADNALVRIIDAIAEARNTLDFDTQIVAYTTAAMRMAENAPEALARIREASGIDFRIIDAETEASLTLAAVRYRLQKLRIEPDAFVLADIGGGSTELISCRGETVKVISLDTGIVTLSERSGTSDALHLNIEAFTQDVHRALEGDSGVLVLTAGTPTTIAAYLNGMDYTTYDPGRINGYRLTREGCIRAYGELMAMDEAERVRYVGVGRENLIIAGILMVRAIYDAMACEEAVVVDDGLREGIALDYYAKR